MNCSFYQFDWLDPSFLNKNIKYFLDTSFLSGRLLIFIESPFELLANELVLVEKKYLVIDQSYSISEFVLSFQHEN